MIPVEDLVLTISPHMVVGLRSSRLTGKEAGLLERFLPAGVIIFARNVEDRAILSRLTGDLLSIYEEAGQPPPLIMADHEGGRTSVLAKAIGTPPSQMAVAMSGREGAVSGLFRETAERMMACGVNMSLSPVADINSEYLNPIIGTRSFGISEDEVSEMVAEAVEAMKAAGMITSIKHFPGHGSTAGDSHVELPITGKNIDQLRIKDLKPFVSGIRSGADSVMTAHIAPVDRMIPSSLDSEMIKGILRGKLGYEGVVLTDGLEMNGILTGSGLKGAASEVSPAVGLLKPACVMRSALEAGNDLLLFTRPADEVFSEIAEVLPLLEGDSAFWENEFPALSRKSRRRISRLRERAGRADGRAGGGSGIYDLVGASAVNVVSDPGSKRSAGSGGSDEVVFIGERADFNYFPVISFIESLLEGLGFEEGSRRYDPAGLRPAFEARSPSSGEMIDLLSYRPGGNAVPAMDGLVVLLGRRPVSGEDIEALTGSAHSVVAAEWPWAARYVPGGRRVVVTYGVCVSSARATAEILKR